MFAPQTDLSQLQPTAATDPSISPDSFSEALSSLKAIARSTAEFVLNEGDESGQHISVHYETMDRNKNLEYYTQGQEDHPSQQFLSPGTSDGILSCWKAGPKFSFHGCNLDVVQPANCEGGSSMIPDREHDQIIYGRVQQHNSQWYIADAPIQILAPKPVRPSNVLRKEVEELEKMAERLLQAMETDLFVVDV
ncbi:hypothetical protein J3R30DRAFT_3730742 [Lentinula aciculospora]|uniref:Uncharacterized protein n=1 Tax=Lentinula aciculospora TaxID=153920 RepID=A0A9W9DTD1_9AGAR|nr:hypothetical protein J3R30DRAFT_3730742 [Lentinula aciculospora]